MSPCFIILFKMGLMGSGQQAPPPYPGQGQIGQPALQQPSTPLFVSPPAKSQRLLHSEAYLRYIEGLNTESTTISKWDQALSGQFSVFTGTFGHKSEQ